MRRAISFALTGLWAISAACSSATDAAERYIGIIDSEHFRMNALVAPDTVVAGEAFEITVTTLGLSGCWKADGVEVTRAAARRTLVPYDRVVGRSCPDILLHLPRPVELSFDSPGTVRIILEGRRYEGAGLTVIEHEVVVR